LFFEKVEIVNDYRETKQHINNLLNKETPVLRLRKVPELRTTGEKNINF